MIAAVSAMTSTKELGSGAAGPVAHSRWRTRITASNATQPPAQR